MKTRCKFRHSGLLEYYYSVILTDNAVKQTVGAISLSELHQGFSNDFTDR